MPRPKHTKRDKNQAQVVADCKKMGMQVWDLADFGGEILDIVVHWRGRSVPVEIKQPGHENELTDDEARVIAELRGVGIPVIVATCVEDIINGWPAGLGEDIYVLSNMQGERTARREGV